MSKNRYFPQPHYNEFTRYAYTPITGSKEENKGFLKTAYHWITLLTSGFICNDVRCIYFHQKNICVEKT